MSSNAFERKVAAVLAKVSGLWVHHPADVMGSSKLRLPADFIYGHAGGWGALEVKETRFSVLPKDQWPVHQRATARAVTASGGAYGLLVRFPDRDLLFLAAPGLSGAWTLDRVRSDHPAALRLLRLDLLPDILLAS